MRIFWSLLFLLSMADARSAGVFDTIRSVPATQRMSVVTDIYNNKVRRKDSVFAIGSIEQLVTIANELGDKPMQCFSISLLADQYARIRGINKHSTELHHEAIRMAESYHLPLLIGICNYRIGRYYYSFKNYPFAFEYLLKADNYFNEIGYKEVPDIGEILYFMGSICYETGNYDKAETFLQSIQQLKTINDYVQKQSLNTLALISKQQNDTARALLYFQKTLAVSIKEKDSAWIGICYTNIGGVYFHSGQYDKAYPLLEQGYRISIVRKEWDDAYMNLLYMARIDIIQNRIIPAQTKIAEAIALHTFYFTIMGRKNLYETQALYYEKTNQQGKTLEVAHKLLLVKDSIAINTDQQAYKKIQLRIETEKHLNEIDKLEAQAHASTQKQYAVIAVLTLLVIVLLLLYNRFRMKAKNAAAEKLRAEEKLKYARQLLQNFTENTRQKNELIEQFASELERLKGNLAGDPVHKERLENFEKLVQSTIFTDTEWTNFRELFDKVHKGFFSRLQQKIPGLSLADTRLVSLIRLGLSNQEIVNMMGMDTDTIGLSKQRLRNRIHPMQDGLTIENLVQAI
jgi:hypothetical protein